MSQQNNSENLVREILFICFANKRLIIDTAAFVFLIVLAVAFLAPKQYTSNASLVVKSKRIERNPEIIQQLQEKQQEVTREDLNSEAEIVTSIEVIKETVLALAKQNKVFEILLNEQGQPANAEEAKKLRRAVGDVTKKLSVTVVRSSQVLDLSLVWSDSQGARIILDELIKRYLDYRNALYQPEKAKDFYSNTVQSYQVMLDIKNSEIAQVMSKIKAPDSTQEIESNLTVKKDYQLKVGALEHEKLVLEADLRYLKKQLNIVDDAMAANARRLPGHEKTEYRFFSNLDNLAIREMAKVVHSKLEEYTSINRHFLPSSERAKSMKQELDKSYNQLIKEVKALVEHKQDRLDAAASSLASLSTKIAELEQRNQNLALFQMQLNKLKDEHKLLEKSYINYYRLLEEAQMLERTQDAAINNQILVMTPAWAGTAATFPNKKVLIPFGVIVAVLMALTVAFITEYFDDTFKRPVDSERFLDVPMLISLSDKAPVYSPSIIERVINGISKLPSRWFKKNNNT